MIQAFDKYLSKHAPFTDFDVNQMADSAMVVVIPVYLEDELNDTLDSLFACKPINAKVSVLLVFNAVEGAAGSIIEKQEETIKQIEAYSNRSGFINIYVLKAFDLPRKHFGAGLARKIGMDLAVHHFSVNEEVNGIIVSLDADSTVETNYFEEIFGFYSNTKNKACSIYFEHPIEGDKYEQNIYAAIKQYEIHLRYYVACLQYIGLPYAEHTIGSCFSCKASSYVSAGGMNRRQGGEEFYFIQKLLQQGNYGNLNTTTVYPSPRISTRVPFGTGPSVKKMVDNNESEYLSYNLQCFVDLKPLFDSIDSYYKISEDEFQKEVMNLPGRVRSFLLNSDFYEELKPIGENCSTIEMFRKRFFHAFNAFKLVKYVNYTHEHFLERMPVYDAAMELLEVIGLDNNDIFEESELLLKFRELQKQ